MSNIEWGMEVSLTGDDKVKGQFKALDETLVVVDKSLDETGNSAKKTGEKFEQAGKDTKAAGEDANKGADGFESAGVETEKSGKKAKKSGDEFEQAGKDTETAGKGAKKGANGFKKVGVETEKAGKKAKESKSWWRSLYGEFFSLKGLIGGIGIGLLTSQIIEVGNVTEGWNASMYAITGSHAAANQELQHTRELAKHLGADIKSTTNSYIQFSAATSGTALEGFKTTKVFDAVSSAMRVLNRSADDTAGALKALEQMVSKGTVQAEELKGQLGERLPGAFRLAADAMGVTTMELGKMLESGSVLAEDLLPKLADVLTEKYGAGLTQALNSPAQSFRNLKNASFEFYEGLSNVVFDELAAGAQLLADAINYLTENAPEIMSVLGGVFEALVVLVGVKLFTAFVALTKTAVLPYIAAVTGASFASLKLNSSLLIATAQMRLFTIASNAAKTSIAFLGGPLGVAMIAGYALYELHGAMNETKTGAEQLEEALGKTTKAIETMTRAEQLSTMAMYKKLINEKKTAIDEFKKLAKEQAEQASNTNGKNSSAAYGMQSWGSSEQAGAATEELEALKNALSDVEGALFDAGMAGIKWNKVIVNGTDVTKENTNSKKSEVTADQKLITSLYKQIHMLGATAKQKFINVKLSKLSADASKEERAEVRKLSEALFDQTEAYKSLDLSDLTSQTNDYGEAWTNVGNVIIDTFGSMADKLTNLGDIQDGYIKQMDDIATRREEIEKITDIEKQTQGLKELKALKNNVIKENTQAQLSAYGSIAGAASKMFKKKTTAAKALAAVEKGIAVAQIALTIKKMYADDISTGKEVTNSGIRAVAKGTEAVATAATAPWPIGLGLAAAMLTFLGSIGLSLGGGSGSSGNGTGAASTVKGGGLSESLSKANEGLEDIMIDQLAELRGLRGDITNVQNLSYGLLSSLLNVDVGHHEIKNATERDLEGSIRGLNADVADGTFTNELKGIFEGIDEAIGESIDILGVETTKSLSDFVYKVGTISFDGLDGEEAGKRLDSILSAQSDLRVESIAPFTEKYQQLGEGALQTLVRLAKEQTVFNDTLDKFGISISNLSEIMQIDVAQSLIELTGGFDKFSELSGSFFENFFNDAERFDFLEKSLTETFDTLGVSMVSSKEEFRALIEGLDLTTDAGQELFAALLEINPAMAEYTDELEKTIEKEAELNAARLAFNDDIQTQINQLDLSPFELALDNLNQRYIDDLAKAEELNADISLLEVFYGKQRIAVIDKHLSDGEKAFEASVTKIAKELTKLLDAIGDTKKGIAANIRNIVRAMGGFDEIGFANSSVNSLTSQLGQGTAQEQVDTIEELNKAIYERYQLELDNMQGLSDAAQNRYDSELAHYQNIKGALKDVATFTKTFALSGASPLSAGQRLGVASSNFYQDLSKAINDKDLDAITNITNSASAYRDEARSYWGSSSQFASVFNAIESGLNQVAALGIETPEIPNAVNEYQTDAIALQNSTITELQGLNGLLDTLALDSQSQASDATQVLTEQWHEQQALMLEANELQKSALAEQQKTNQKLDQANQNSAQVISLLQKSNSQANKNLKAAEELNNQLMARSGTNA